MIENYFAANPTSGPLMAWAAFFGVLWLVCMALRGWDAAFVAREIKRLERQDENRHREWAWTWCVLVADGYYAGPTRRITEMEWRGASADIQRELSRTEQFDEAVRRG